MTEYIQPELLILIPVLYLIGYAIKKTSLISSRFIPLILGVIGIILCIVYEVTTWNFNLLRRSHRVFCAPAQAHTQIRFTNSW